jgi:hypothetical protein
MNKPDIEQARVALEGIRAEVTAAIEAWRAGGGRDPDLALYVDGEHPGKPKVTAHARAELQLHVPDFEPTVPIELAKHPPGKVPAIVDLHDDVRHYVWIELGPPLRW